MRLHGSTCRSLLWSLYNPHLFHINRFIGGELNTCYNAVDKHVENGRGDQLAVIHDSPVTNTVTSLTFSQLQHQVITPFAVPV